MLGVAKMARDMSRMERAAKRLKGQKERKRSLPYGFPKCLALFPDEGCLNALPWKPSSDCAYTKLDEEGNTIYVRKCPNFEPNKVIQEPKTPDMQKIEQTRKFNITTMRFKKGGR